MKALVVDVISKVVALVAPDVVSLEGVEDNGHGVFRDGLVKRRNVKRFKQHNGLKKYRVLLIVYIRERCIPLLESGPLREHEKLFAFFFPIEVEGMKRRSGGEGLRSKLGAELRLLDCLQDVEVDGDDDGTNFGLDSVPEIVPNEPAGTPLLDPIGRYTCTKSNT